MKSKKATLKKGNQGESGCFSRRGEEKKATQLRRNHPKRLLLKQVWLRKGNQKRKKRQFMLLFLPHKRKKGNEITRVAT